MRAIAIASTFLIGWAAATASAAEPSRTVSPEPSAPAEPTQSARLTELPAKTREPAPRPPHGRICFNQAEAREKISAHRLSDPIHALRAGRQQGEALRAKLCRWKPDEFVYEVYVLKRDGHLVRVYMNAETGQLVGALGEGERK